MNIDLRTLILILSLSNFLQVFAIFFQYQVNRTYRGVGWWLLAFLSIAVGFFFTLLRDVMNFDLLTIIGASTLTFSGPVFVYIGVMRFLGRKEKRELVIISYLFFVPLYFYFTYVSNDINIRSVISAVMIAVFSLLTSRNIYLFKPRSIKTSATFLSIAWFIQGAFFTFRAVDLLTASPINSYFTPVLIQTATFIFVLVISTMVTYGLIIMINQRAKEEISESKAQFELIFHTSPDAAVVTRLSDGVIVNSNEGFAALSGYTRDETIGRSSLVINLYKNPDDRKKIVDLLLEKGFCDNIEAVFQRKDGSLFAGSMSAKIFRLGDVPHIISITRDISERVREEDQIRQLNADLEQRVAQRTVHLEAANKEILDLAYSISHDLHIPLRAIAGFSQILLEDYPNQVDEEGQRLLRVIQQNAYRMGQLIKDMLSLLRVSQVELNISIIDMTSLVKTVFNETASVEVQGKVVFTVSPLEQVEGDADLMHMVWNNLISNAIKYSLPKDERSIHITSQILGDEIVYSIEDKGVGFNPEFTGKLFGLFERLHKVDEFEGTGMGLAIVKRVIQRHGGKVWAEGLDNQGATFYFSLPQRQMKHE